MRKFEGALHAWVMAHPSLGAILAPAGGFQAVVVTQEKPRFPVGVYTKISGAPDYTHDGPSGIQSARYQIDWYSPNPAQARQLGDTLAGALALALAGGPVTMQGPAGTVRVDAAFLEDEDGQWVDEHRVHWVRQDFVFTFTEDP